jgi:hypothetical protein
MIQHPYIIALLVILGVGIVSWLVSVIKKDVSFVDSLWSLFFLIAAVVFALEAQPLSVKGKLVLALVVIWSLRLSIYITARNWGKPEDYRYQSIRANNEPGFAFKSSYIVFGLQGRYFLLFRRTPRSAGSTLSLRSCGSWVLSSRRAAITSWRGSRLVETVRDECSIRDCGGTHATRTTLAIFASGGRSSCLRWHRAVGGVLRRRF